MRHNYHRAWRESRRQRAEGLDVRFPRKWHGSRGTLYEMPVLQSIESMEEAAASAVDHAQAVRRHHARKSKRGNKQRETDIKVAMERIQGAMRPIRRRLGRAPYEPPYVSFDGLREASDALQKERRKLWKLQKRKPQAAKPAAPPPEPDPEPIFEPREERISRAGQEIQEALAALTRAERGEV